MSTAAEILVIILSVVLAVFLILSIVLTVLLIKVTKQIGRLRNTLLLLLAMRRDFRHQHSSANLCLNKSKSSASNAKVFGMQYFVWSITHTVFGSMVMIMTSNTYYDIPTTKY